MVFLVSRGIVRTEEDILMDAKDVFDLKDVARGSKLTCVLSKSLQCSAEVLYASDDRNGNMGSNTIRCNVGGRVIEFDQRTGLNFGNIEETPKSAFLVNLEHYPCLRFSMRLFSVLEEARQRDNLPFELRQLIEAAIGDGQ